MHEMMIKTIRVITYLIPFCISGEPLIALSLDNGYHLERCLLDWLAQVRRHPRHKNLAQNSAHLLFRQKMSQDLREFFLLMIEKLGLGRRRTQRGGALHVVFIEAMSGEMCRGVA